MNAEILCIGTELLLGNIVNTNAAYLSEQLARLGINVYHHSVVGDNPQRLHDALDIAVNRADLVIMTGGLGPTYDDLSKETVSNYFNRQLVLHQPSFKKLEEFYAARSVKMQPNNEKQAYQPEGAVVFTNHSGTAPGAAIEENGKIAIMLPGPPRELKLMFETEVLPYLQQFSENIIVSHDIHLFGIGESQAETLLRDIMTQNTNPTLAPYAKEEEVMLRLTASAPTEAEGYAMMKPVLEQIEPIIGQYIYGIDVPDLQTALVTYLLEHNITVSTAESCTGGLISKSITDVAGCSSVYPGGVCSYFDVFKQTSAGERACCNDGDFIGVDFGHFTVNQLDIWVCLDFLCDNVAEKFPVNCKCTARRHIALVCSLEDKTAKVFHLVLEHTLTGVFPH